MTKLDEYVTVKQAANYRACPRTRSQLGRTVRFQNSGIQ